MRMRLDPEINRSIGRADPAFCRVWKVTKFYPKYRGIYRIYKKSNVKKINYKGSFL